MVRQASLEQTPYPPSTPHPLVQHNSGKQDDLCIAIQLSLIGCQKFWQEGKYRNFRSSDYLTPQGLDPK